MNETARHLGHKGLSLDLRTLWEKGLRQIRQLELSSLGEAVRLVAGGPQDEAAAIEILLRAAIGRLGGGAYAESASLLFGLEQGTRVENSRVRREYAAAALGRTAETFRKKYQPAMLGDIASQILQLVAERPPGDSSADQLRLTAFDFGSAEQVSPLDASVEAAVVDGLARQFEPGRGFPSQTYDERAFSLATTGACAHVVVTGGGVPESKKREILAYICGSIQEDGTLPTHHYQGESIETTWAAGQCLLALTTRPDLVDIEKAKGLARTLLRYQSDRGWSLRRPGQESHLEPLYILYPLLAIVQAARLGWIDSADVDGSLRRLRDPLRNELQDENSHPVRRLIAEYELDLVGAVLGERENLVSILLQRPAQRASAALAEPETYVRLADYIIIERDQPLWYSKVWRPALYLLARRLYPPPSPITLLLGAELIETYSSEHNGWLSDPTPNDASPTRASTWATALGLRATRRLKSDLTTLGLDPSSWHQMVIETRRAAWR